MSAARAQVARAARRGVASADRLRRRQRLPRRSSGPPPTGVDVDLRRAADGRAGRGPEWPFLLLLIVPWLVYGAALLLARAQACLLCAPPLR